MTGSGLEGKVRDWLSQEGYPLEFYAASVLQAAQARVHRGLYTRDGDGNAREIDVQGDWTLSVQDGKSLRLSMIIECKWSKSKPWVVFSQLGHGMGPAAAVTQAVGCPVGQSLMWWAAGTSALQAAFPFATSGRVGFDGVQALSKGKDPVYSALQGLTTKAQLSSAQVADEVFRNPIVPQAFAQVFFPVVVVDGEVFEAFASPGGNGVELSPVDWIRLHWRGAQARELLTSIDIVRKDAFEGYVEQWTDSLETIGRAVLPAWQNLDELIASRDASRLRETRASRGVLGRPALVAELLRYCQMGFSPGT